MRILKLTLKNFMRYTDASLEFSPGFNAIVGSTDSGKSSILRAITWVLYNRPAGSEMCRDGTDETSVTLEVLTGTQVHEVTRVRSKKRNAYCLDGIWYDTVARGVPEDIQAALGCQLAQLGPNLQEMLNISKQMDPPFMLMAPGSETAKILGNLSGITQIDTALASLRPDLSTAKREIDISERAQKAHAAASTEFVTLEKDLKSLEAIKKDLRNAQKINQRLEQLDQVRVAMDNYNEILVTIDPAIIEQESLLRNRATLSKAISTHNKLQELQHLLSLMDTYNQEITQTACLQETTQDSITELRLELRSLLHEAQQCPTCGQSTIAL